MIRILIALAFVTSNALADQAANADPESLYFPCASCHGENGEGSEPIHAPALAGQSKEYLARQLRHYRDGLRGAHPEDVYGKQMALMRVNFRDDQTIDTLSTYISSMPAWQSTSAKADVGESVEILYQSCVACHGINGEGINELSSPKIGGLNATYLRTQLTNYRNGIRGNSDNDIFGQQMRAEISMLKDGDDISSVAAYVSNLSGLSD